MDAHLTAPAAQFGELLRQRRRAAGMTQEELAQAAGVSTRAVSDLERRVNQFPRRDTARLLADALGLTSEETAEFLDAGRTSGDRAVVARTVSVEGVVGREDDVAAVRELLRTRPLVTLTGPPGVGKTTLAEAAAARSADLFLDGVVHVALDGVRDPALVPSVLATAFGVREGAGTSLEDALCVRLDGRRVLVVLDNFEQLLDAAPVVARLADRVALLGILVTSRAPLRVRSETEFRVSPLALAGTRGEDPLSAPAVAFFLRRVEQAGVEWRHDPVTVACASRICAVLDGLPLALELAAVRARTLSLPELERRLSTRLDLLTVGNRDAPERHRSLRGAISWTAELLPETARRLFRRLAVFRGGWTLETASAVGGNGADVVDDLGVLLEQSLVQRDASSGRFRMLETVREFAAEALVDAGEADEMRRRHAQTVLAVVGSAQSRLVGAEQGRWFGVLDAEHDNVRAALEWAAEVGDPRVGLSIAACLWRFWEVRGHLAEGRRWLEGFLRAATDGRAEVEPELRAEAFNAAGNLARDQGDQVRAEECYRSCRLLAASVGDRRLLAIAGNNLGNLALDAGRYADAQSWYEDSVQGFRALGDDLLGALVLNNLAEARCLDGDVREVVPILVSSIRVFRRLGDRRGEAMPLLTLSWVLGRFGHPAAARRLVLAALRRNLEVGDGRGCAGCLDGLAEVLAEAGNSQSAARLVAGARAWRRAHGERAQPLEVVAARAAWARAERALGPEGLAAAEQAGGVMSLAELCDLATSTLGEQ